VNSSETQCGISGPVREPILQIHPSLWCNLKCGHCYSGSNPWSREQLDPELVRRAVSDAAELGYKVVSCSGGEPFLYGGLSGILRHAKSLGMKTAVTTNGYFLQKERLENLDGCVDVLAISVDGPPETHNQVRGAAQAFDRMLAGLEVVRESGIHFGMIHTATKTSWEHLVWLGEFAFEQGARLLQIHPLEMAGRARTEMASFVPDEETLAKIFLLSFALANKYGETMRIQCDLLAREHAKAAPELLYAQGSCADGLNASNECNPEIGTELESAEQLAALLSILVLEPDGCMVPVSYGFSRNYAVCDLKSVPLKDGWRGFRQERYADFLRLCRRVFEHVTRPEGPELFNWHEVVVAASHGRFPAILSPERLNPEARLTA